MRQQDDLVLECSSVNDSSGRCSMSGAADTVVSTLCCEGTNTDMCVLTVRIRQQHSDVAGTPDAGTTDCAPGHSKHPQTDTKHAPHRRRRTSSHKCAVTKKSHSPLAESAPAPDSYPTVLLQHQTSLALVAPPASPLAPQQTALRALASNRSAALLCRQKLH
jgi:hypothetical protein